MNKESRAPIVYRKGSDAIGHPIFPSPTAGDGSLDREGSYRCKQCGFQNLAAETESPGGGEEGMGGITIVDNEPEVTQGCKLCGSLNSR